MGPKNIIVMRVRRTLLFRPLLKYSPPTISAEANIKVFLNIIRKGYNLSCQREMFCLAVKGFYSFKKKEEMNRNINCPITEVNEDPNRRCLSSHYLY